MASRSRDQLRRFVWRLMHWSGTLWLWRFLHRDRITILMLHGVMDTGHPTSWTPLRPQLSRQTLEDTIRWLSRYYRFVSLEEAVAMITGKIPVQPYSMVLTFDDGYQNNFRHALPILRRYQVPAAFFIATGHIDQRRPFWFDRLDYVLQHTAVDGRRVSIGETSIVLQAHDRTTLQASYKRLRDAAKGINRPDHEMIKELDELAASLESECGQRLSDIFTDDDWSAVATWQEIENELATDIIIGSHTIDHVRLGLVDDQTCDEQLQQSKQRIEQQLRRPCHYLCYPSGSFTLKVAQQARACGYRAALTSETGTNKVGDDPMTLRRLSFPKSESKIELLADVSGCSLFLSHWVARVRRWIHKGTGRSPVAVPI